MLSIHPRYADAIFQGQKKVEFRRRGFGRDVSHVVVYSTKPVEGITGVFTVETIEYASPVHLWRRYRAVSGLSASRFFEYYAGACEGVAIKVARAARLSKPVRLAEVGARLTPPQSFRYLSQDDLARIMSLSAADQGGR
ncbi:ASCH domain-containing protein [bacterium]|nr:ASCH domain-containing protein [bacterium]